MTYDQLTKLMNVNSKVADIVVGLMLGKEHPELAEELFTALYQAPPKELKLIRSFINVMAIALKIQMEVK